MVKENIQWVVTQNIEAVNTILMDFAHARPSGIVQFAIVLLHCRYRFRCNFISLEPRLPIVVDFFSSVVRLANNTNFEFWWLWYAKE